MKRWQRALLWLVGLLAAGLMQGCATLGAKSAGDRVDPWEHWNRKVFSFNEKLDDKVLRPVATAYSNIIPRPVRNSIGNFFGNAADAWSAVNNFLQGKLTNGLHDVIRVGTNTLLGVGGFVDVATEFGLDHQYEDFGQTLGRWGFGPGAYVVWPVFGPSSVRDSVGLPLDLAASPALLINDGRAKWGITGLQLINKRASLLGATQVLNDIALDKYTFVRDAYLQRRRSLISDGDDESSPPPDESKLDGDDGGTAAPPAGKAPQGKPAEPPSAGDKPVPKEPPPKQSESRDAGGPAADAKAPDAAPPPSAPPEPAKDAPPSTQ